MNYIISILILLVFTIGLRFFKVKEYFDTLIYVLLGVLFFTLMILSDSWQINYFCFNDWKYLLLFLISLSFFIIVNIIQDKIFDVYLLNFLILIGSLVIILCDHLLMVYLGIELQTFSLFILISKNRVLIKGSEAGLKYFILGALSSGFYLLGLSLFFISGVSLNLSDLVLLSGETLYTIGSILIILSLVFKLALFPLHFWIPDIYEGSSWDVISMISTLPKISVLVVLLQIGLNLDLLLFSSLLSIVIGTVGALNQTKLKRLLAYSGISHMGFIVLGYNVSLTGGYEVGMFYLFVYMLTMLSLFLLIINNIWGKDYYIIELSNINTANKTLGLTWMLIFLSIAGIPPLVGFMNKWFVLLNAINYNYLISSFIGILFSIIGAGYYLRIVKIIYFQKNSSYKIWEDILKVKNNNVKERYYIFLGIIIYFISFFIINPFPFIANIHSSLIYFF